MHSLKLKGKTALITGGNSGIGLATAQLFVAEGARVIITGRNEASLKEAVALLGTESSYILADKAQLSAVKQMAEQVTGPVDILFYNAGVAQFAPIAQTTEAIFDANMNINFRSAFFTVQYLLPKLAAGASIIFNGTFLGTGTMVGNAAYGASKAALIHLAKTLAVELGPQGIRANTISPGAIATPIYSKLGMNNEQLETFSAGFVPKIPLGRFGASEEIAKAALFLASSDSSYVNGAELLVDGGTAVQW